MPAPVARDAQRRGGVRRAHITAQLPGLRGRWAGFGRERIARHAAQAYGRNGVDRARALARIKELFDAEWAGPTTEARDLSEGQ